MERDLSQIILYHEVTVLSEQIRNTGDLGRGLNWIEQVLVLVYGQVSLQMSVYVSAVQVSLQVR